MPGEILGPLVLAVDHVGLAVADLDVAIAFYADTFGLRVLHREDNAEQGVAEAMLGAPGSHADATQLQLLAPLTPQSAIATFLQRSGPGLQQLAFRVHDVDDASARLRERGLRILYEVPRRGTRGSKINFVHPHDAGGVLVELVQTSETH